MENRNLEKALDITAALLKGEEVGTRANTSLYEEYSHNAEVYDITRQILKKLDINLYEYNDSLFISAGSNNRVFGFSNEELKKNMGLKLNRELYLVYFIMYCVITEFYKDSAGRTYLEYLKLEDVIKSVSGAFAGLLDDGFGSSVSAAEKDSFKAMALMWDELPDVSVEDKSGSRSAKNSHMGFVKLVFNFLTSQQLFTENAGRYYPTDRFRAIAENYFDQNRGRFYEMMNREGKDNAED